VGQFIFECPEKKVSKEDRSMMRWTYWLNLREFCQRICGSCGGRRRGDPRILTSKST
jgi:hypothetical protein